MGFIMTTKATIPDLAHLIKTGDLAEAKRQASTVLANADPHDLQVVGRCAYILETWPKIGVLKLRAYWRNADAHDRAIIATCAPDEDEPPRTRPTDDHPPRWTPQNTYQAPRDLRHEVMPERVRPPRPREESALVATYERDRAGIDDLPQHPDRPDGYAIDYDRAAVPPLWGTPCVRCWLERSATDQARHPDDGLCGDCRDRGRPGIPSLPEGHTRADVIQARCAFITATYPHLAVRLLRRYWQQAASDQDRSVIAAWVRRHDIEE